MKKTFRINKESKEIINLVHNSFNLEFWSFILDVCNNDDYLSDIGKKAKRCVEEGKQTMSSKKKSETLDFLIKVIS